MFRGITTGIAAMAGLLALAGPAAADAAQERSEGLLRGR